MKGVEIAKHDLSVKLATQVSVQSVAAKDGKTYHLNSKITRAQFEALTKDLLDRTEECVNKALQRAKLEAKNIDEIVLVGGSTRMPMVEN